MSRWAVVVAVAAVFGAGVLLGVLMPDRHVPQSGPLTASDVTRPEEPASPDAPRAGLSLGRTERDGCDGVREELMREIVVLRGQISALGGAPTSWPEGVPDVFSEAAIATWLDSVEAQVQAERLTLDCAEYPCVAVYRHDADQPADSAVVDALRLGFQEQSGQLGRARVAVRGTQDGAFAALSFGPSEDGDLETRLKMRMDELLAAEAEP